MATFCCCGGGGGGGPWVILKKNTYTQISEKCITFDITFKQLNNSQLKKSAVALQNAGNCIHKDLDLIIS